MESVFSSSTASQGKIFLLGGGCKWKGMNSSYRKKYKLPFQRGGGGLTYEKDLITRLASWESKNGGAMRRLRGFVRVGKKHRVEGGVGVWVIVELYNR